MLNERQTTILLSTLKYLDPTFHDYICHASKVKLFIYTTEWEETNTEGPIYLYSTLSSSYRLIILNTMVNNHQIIDLKCCSTWRDFIMIESDKVYGISFGINKEYETMEKEIKEKISIQKVKDGMIEKFVGLKNRKH